MNPNHDRPGAGQGFWSMLEERERDALRQICRSEIYDPRQRIFTEGEPSDFVLVIRSGWMKITGVTSDGAPMTLALRTVGELVGESGSIALSRTATAIALDEVRALHVTAGEFSGFLRHHPRAEHALRRTYSDRRIESDRKCMDFGKASSSRRLAQLLLELADRSGHIEDDTGGVVLGIPLAQGEFANLIGAATVTVERALRNWRQRGIVATNYRKVILRDLSALRRIAG